MRLVLLLRLALSAVAGASPTVVHLANSAVAGASPTVVRIVDGTLASTGRVIGRYTTSIQREVVDALFAPVSGPASYSNESVISNATVLRTLELEGDYVADEPLRLPSLFVLRLNGSLVEADNLTMADRPRFSALVVLNRTTYSAVVGGTFNATKLAVPGSGGGSRGMQAISIVDGHRNAVRGVRAVAANDAAIGINGGSENEVANCDVGGDGGYEAPARCIWTLATSRALVHGNHVHHCRMHALDFDAYTSTSVAYNNLCEHNGEEGIFVEETANGNFVANNVVRNNAHGIGVYSNAVGPVQNNFFVANVAEDNPGGGITAGGYGHVPTKHSSYNVFLGNTATRNGGGNGDFNPAHGATVGDYWTGNAGAWSVTPHANANTSRFEP